MWDDNDKFLCVVHEAIEMFGAARCMFATNFPVDNRLQDGYWSAGKLYSAFKKISDRYLPYSQKLLWHKTAQSVYLHRPTKFVPREGKGLSINDITFGGGVAKN